MEPSVLEAYARSQQWRQYPVSPPPPDPSAFLRDLSSLARQVAPIAVAALQAMPLAGPAIDSSDIFVPPPIGDWAPFGAG